MPWVPYHRIGVFYNVTYGKVAIYPIRGYHELTDLEVFYVKRQGTGTRLVQIALRKAKTLQIAQLHVTVGNSDEARGFWQSFDIEYEGWLKVI